jgi:hypothetical protein
MMASRTAITRSQAEPLPRRVFGGGCGWIVLVSRVGTRSYRLAVGLSPRRPLATPSVSERHAAIARALLDHDPRVRAGLAAGAERARSGELPAVGTAVMSRELARPQLLELRRRQGRGLGRARAHAFRARRETRARELGHRDLATYLRERYTADGGRVGDLAREPDVALSAVVAEMDRAGIPRAASRSNGPRADTRHVARGQGSRPDPLAGEDRDHGGDGTDGTDTHADDRHLEVEALALVRFAVALIGAAVALGHLLEALPQHRLQRLHGRRRVPLAGAVAHVLEHALGDKQLLSDNEVGPVSIVGSGFGSGRTAFVNGAVSLGSSLAPTRAALNATDGNPVTVTDAGLLATGDFGPLTLTRSGLVVGLPRSPAGVATTAALSLDRGSDATFNLAGGGSAAGTDYSQLRSDGTVKLGGAHLEVAAAGGQPGAPCPAPRMGTVYTLVSTTGRLAGSFDVAHGNDLTVGSADVACPLTLPFALRIDYHKSGSPQTVTVTVVPAPPAGVRPGVAGAAPVSGVVRVRLRRHGAFKRVKRGRLIPAGSELDTTHGRVRIFAATNAHGGVDSAELYGGRFILRQKRRARPRTTFALSQPLNGCRPAGHTASLAHRRRRHRRRHVWVTEHHGRFNTRAQYVGTSVQGTTWLTADTCTTSRVKVTRGKVTVRDLVHHRKVRLGAGQSFTVHKRR